MSKEKLRQAFQKVKKDVDFLKTELLSLSQQISDIKRTLIKKDRQTDRQTIDGLKQTDTLKQQTNQERISNERQLRAIRAPNSIVSIGNGGVQTDRQTDRPADRQKQKFVLAKKGHSLREGEILEDGLTRIEKVSQVLNSLDSLKRELRTQFKKLTQQEMLVFSIVYQLEEEGLVADYSLIATKTNLSQSSIRDYIQKLVKKGIPLNKRKENNKRVILSIPTEFKRMATLETIISLREL